VVKKNALQVNKCISVITDLIIIHKKNPFEPV